MNIKQLFFSSCLLFLVTTISTAQETKARWCYENATISVKGNSDTLSFMLEELGDTKVIRFSSRPLVTAYAYLITDEQNIIVKVSHTNFVELADLPAGKYRVWSFSYIGNISAEVGQDAAATQLASFCSALSQNFIPLEIVDPNSSESEPRPESTFKTVADAILRNNLLQILERGLEHTDLVDALREEGPFTVFAPVNNAFAALEPADLAALFDDKQGILRNTMLNHVVAMDLLATDLEDGQVLTTLLGEEVMVEINEEGVFIGGSKVLQTDIVAENGVVHLIQLLIRP